ncbi:MAG: FUSC family protein [Candidatus Fournierella pullistercoris]|uniref:FUSC family protein n=1 Tax=Candidatus Allofournierella pullistercoris TaxID=2838597 RepID=A0A948T334_9FIRM|nr:FUSC family protein [Candidatus Fournierella pullistercoris]
MKPLQERMLLWQSRWKAALPTILVSIFLLLSIWGLFGRHYVIMVSFLTLLFRTKHENEFVWREMLRACGLMLLLCLAAFMASYSFVTMLALDFVIPFLLVYLLSDKFSPKNYFVYGMEFVFLQLVPVTAQKLPAQIGVLSYGLGVVWIALWAHSLLVHHQRNYATVRKGLGNLAQQLDKLARGESPTAEHNALPAMLVHMNQVIYTTRGFTHLADGYGKINYWFMIFFQRFYYFTEHFLFPDKLTYQDKLYCKDLSHLLVQIAGQINQKPGLACARELAQFRQKNSLSEPDSAEAMEQMLDILALALEAMPSGVGAKPEKGWKLPSQVERQRQVYAHRKGVLQRFALRFALRLSVVLCISFAFSVKSGLEHAYWYPMTAFLMLMPYAEESQVRINNRILGTLGGVAVTLVLMWFFKSTTAYLIIMMIMTCFMYYAPVTSWTMTVYSTCYGLTMAQMSLGVMTASGLRILYVALAAGTAFLANRFLLPTTAKREFSQNVKELFALDLTMIEEMRHQHQQGTQDLNQMRSCMVQSHLLEKELAEYIQTQMTPDQQEFYSQLLPINRQLLSEVEQLNGYLRSRSQTFAPHQSRLLNQLFDNLEDTVRRVMESYTSTELAVSLQPGSHPYAFGQLESKLYFNRLALGCLETMSQMLELSQKRRQQQGAKTVRDTSVPQQEQLRPKYTKYGMNKY